MIEDHLGLFLGRRPAERRWAGGRSLAPDLLLFQCNCRVVRSLELRLGLGKPRRRGSLGFDSSGALVFQRLLTRLTLTLLGCYERLVPSLGFVGSGLDLVLLR